MTIGKRIKQLRVEMDLTQADVGRKLNVHQKQISAYERAVNLPSTEVLIKLAEIFDVTLDYLAFEKHGKTSPINIQDRELLRRFEVVDGLQEEEKSLAKAMLDLIISKHKLKKLAEAT